MTAAFARHAGIVAAALGLGLAVLPARAAEDGQASLLSGLASTFGITHDNDARIDYRERSKLVLPPKMTLPPPGSASLNQDPAWPTDVETVRAKKRKAIEAAEPTARQRASRSYRLIKPGDDVKVSTSGFDNGGPPCRRPDPKTGECPQWGSGGGMNWNPLTWVGLEKKPKTTLGPEPPRDNLVDPPAGYRAPAEGVGAKVDN